MENEYFASFDMKIVPYSLQHISAKPQQSQEDHKFIGRNDMM